MEVLQSKEIQDYIKDKYDGAVMLQVITLLTRALRE